MDIETFWRLVDSSKRAAGTDREKQVEELKASLAGLSKKELFDFEYIYSAMLGNSYNYDLWAAITVLRGDCSDDSFEYFRDWLISMGQDVYQNALNNPATIGSITDLYIEVFEEQAYLCVAEFGSIEEGDPQFAEFEEFHYAAREVYAEKFGEEMPYVDYGYPAAFEPAPEVEIVEDEGDEYDKATADTKFPTLAAKRKEFEAGFQKPKL